ncbi:hypothetical protein LCL97_09000 [Seohaeicola saemankumensis]|nr:hypothetical protein [Seohaeicola saemankumensis]MCA0870961.1 hypothetical protein [Seohaeicola saemankumensis]
MIATIAASSTGDLTSVKIPDNIQDRIEKIAAGDNLLAQINVVLLGTDVFGKPIRHHATLVGNFARGNDGKMTNWGELAVCGPPPGGQEDKD